MIEKVRNIVKNNQFEEIDGVLVDLFTANAIITVYDALSEENKKHLAGLPIAKAGLVCLKLVSNG